jgi:hypothetical protein
VLVSTRMFDEEYEIDFDATPFEVDLIMHPMIHPSVCQLVSQKKGNKEM